MSENVNIIKALVEVQKEIINPPNTANNPFFKSKYAPLSEILNIVRPLLTKNGIALIQNTGTITTEDGTDKLFVQTKLMHTSGECVQSNDLILKLDKNSVQGMGSAITYGRRYQLTSLLGITNEDDNDGNTQESKTNNKQKPDKPKSTPKPPKPKTKPAKPKQPLDKEINNIADSIINEKKGKNPGGKEVSKEDQPEVIDMKAPYMKFVGIAKVLDQRIESIKNKGNIKDEQVLKWSQDFFGTHTMDQEQLDKVKKLAGVKE